MAKAVAYIDARGNVVRVESDKHGKPVVARGMVIASGCMFYDGVSRLREDIFLDKYKKV